jgi:dCMP deaminase
LKSRSLLTNALWRWLLSGLRIHIVNAGRWQRALIVKEKMIISDGYNGTPAGFENVCEDENNVTKPYVLHAEANAITKVAKSNNSSEESTLYVTTSPCMECSKLIIQSGIKRVVFCNRYRITDGQPAETCRH